MLRLSFNRPRSVRVRADARVPRTRRDPASTSPPGPPDDLATPLHTECVRAAAGRNALHAQGTPRPPHATTKFCDAEDVHIVCNGNHQAMLIGTEEGLIEADPIADGRPEAGFTSTRSAN